MDGEIGGEKEGGDKAALLVSSQSLPLAPQLLDKIKKKRDRESHSLHAVMIQQTGFS